MQAHPSPTLASCQSPSSLFHVVSSCAILSDDTSCAQVLVLQLDGGHKGTHHACRNGWLAARPKSRGLEAETEKEISNFLNCSCVYYNSLGKYGFACQIFVLIRLPSDGICWHMVPYIIQV